MDENNLHNGQNPVQPPRAVVYDTMPVKSNMAIASLVTSLFALFFSWTVSIGFVFGIVGLVCSIVSLSRKEKSKGMAIAGLIISVLSMLFAGVVMLLIFILELI